MHGGEQMSNGRLCILLTRRVSTRSESSGRRSTSSPMSTLASCKSCTPISMSPYGSAEISPLPTATAPVWWTSGPSRDTTTLPLTRSSTSFSTLPSEVPTGGSRTPRAANPGSIPVPMPKRTSGMRKTLGFPRGRTRPWRSKRFPCGSNATEMKSYKKWVFLMFVDGGLWLGY